MSRWPPLEERLWEKVRRSDGCWEWQGSGTVSGYGRLRLGQLRFVAHRVAYELTYGPIPAGLIVCHRCDNPPCCNPEHLFVGTPADNARDRDAKGRTSRGPRHAATLKIRRGSAVSSKLTEQDVLAIRLAPRHIGEQKRLAEQYGVHSSVISRIVTRQTWTHV